MLFNNPLITRQSRSPSCGPSSTNSTRGNSGVDLSGSICKSKKFSMDISIFFLNTIHVRGIIVTPFWLVLIFQRSLTSSAMTTLVFPQKRKNLFRGIAKKFPLTDKLILLFLCQIIDGPYRNW